MINDKVLVVFFVILLCHFLVNVVLSGIAGATSGVVFNNRISDVSKNHTIQVTPAGFTFMIWNIIYLWLIVAFAYLSVNVFCRTKPKEEDESRNYEERNPIFGRVVTFTQLINAIAYTSWLFLWDNQLMSASAIALTCIAVTNWITIVKFSMSFWRHCYTVKAASRRRLIGLGLVQNGFAVYTTWTTVASLINIAVAMVYDGNVDDAAASLIVLVVLTTLMTLWMVLELMFWDNYFRYMTVPLPVVLWALIGIYAKQCSDPDRIHDSVKYYTLILLIVSGCLAASKIIFMIYRHLKRPFYHEVSNDVGIAII